MVERNRARTLLGTPESLRERLLEMATGFAADELMVLTITGDYATRRRSYEQLADAFGLSVTAPAAAVA